MYAVLLENGEPVNFAKIELLTFEHILAARRWGWVITTREEIEKYILSLKK